MAGKRATPDDLIDTAPLSDLLRQLARRGVVRNYRKGSVIIEEGDHGDTIFIILGGRLRAYSRHAVSQREVTYGHYGAGEYLGEMGLDGGPRSASVEVLDDAWVVRIDKVTLQAFIAQNPGFAFELLDKVIRRARSATLGLRQIALNDVYGRIKDLLDTLAVPQADGTRMILERLTDADVAQRVGCSREMVSRVMKDLRDGDHVVKLVAPPRIQLLGRLPARW